MRRMIFIISTATTVGLVVAIGASAVAVAMVPADQPGHALQIEAIAAPGQDPSEGAATTAVRGIPVAVMPPDATTTSSKVPSSSPADDATPSPTSDPTTPTAPPTTATTPPATGPTPTPTPTTSGNSGKDDKGKDDKAKDDAKKAKDDAKNSDKSGKTDGKNKTVETTPPAN